MDYSKQPKIELHLHLDCSLSYELVKKLKPSVTLEEYLADYREQLVAERLLQLIIQASLDIHK